MRQTTSPRPFSRLVSAALFACLLAPLPGRAADEGELRVVQKPADEGELRAVQEPAPETVEPAPEAAPPATEAAPTAETPAEPAAPAPVSSSPRYDHWYQPALKNLDVAMDLVVVRPLALITLGAGAAMFVPAALMTAPNGRDSITDAYQRFVQEPADYFYNRPLGEF